ncbi:MAG: PIG-L family deacetylase [Chloroflexi bacterium]|nr:PIG-L family deacetylase [Chloroflexota bacterium]
MSGEKLSLLAVFAHPEDESFGPAGTLAKYASEGIAVSLVTATRSKTDTSIEESSSKARDRVCSCRASGVRRACLFDYRPGELHQVAPNVVEERLVRLIRELRPQVIVTFGPRGLNGDSDNQILNAATTSAFRTAGDPDKFPQHIREGLAAYAPQKLYYCVLPNSIVLRWGIQDICSVPDNEITAVLDVSSFSEAMKSALYCQRHHALDWLMDNPQVEWNSEYYALVESHLNRRPRREKDLFAGLR